MKSFKQWLLEEEETDSRFNNTLEVTLKKLHNASTKKEVIELINNITDSNEFKKIDNETRDKAFKIINKIKKECNDEVDEVDEVDEADEADEADESDEADEADGKEKTKPISKNEASDEEKLTNEEITKKLVKKILTEDLGFTLTKEIEELINIIKSNSVSFDSSDKSIKTLKNIFEIYQNLKFSANEIIRLKTIFSENGLKHYNAVLGKDGDKNNLSESKYKLWINELYDQRNFNLEALSFIVYIISLKEDNPEIFTKNGIGTRNLSSIAPLFDNENDKTVIKAFFTEDGGIYKPTELTNSINEVLNGAFSMPSFKKIAELFKGKKYNNILEVTKKAANASSSDLSREINDIKSGDIDLQDSSDAKAKVSSKEREERLDSKLNKDKEFDDDFENSSSILSLDIPKVISKEAVIGDNSFLNKVRNAWKNKVKTMTAKMAKNSAAKRDAKRNNKKNTENWSDSIEEGILTNALKSAANTNKTLYEFLGLKGAKDNHINKDGTTNGELRAEKIAENGKAVKEANDTFDHYQKKFEKLYHYYDTANSYYEKSKWQTEIKKQMIELRAEIHKLVPILDKEIRGGILVRAGKNIKDAFTFSDEELKQKSKDRDLGVAKTKLSKAVESFMTFNSDDNDTKKLAQLVLYKVATKDFENPEAALTFIKSGGRLSEIGFPYGREKVIYDTEPGKSQYEHEPKEANKHDNVLNILTYAGFPKELKCTTGMDMIRNFFVKSEEGKKWKEYYKEYEESYKKFLNALKDLVNGGNNNEEAVAEEVFVEALKFASKFNKSLNLLENRTRDEYRKALADGKKVDRKDFGLSFDQTKGIIENDNFKKQKAENSSNQEQKQEDNQQQNQNNQPQQNTNQEQKKPEENNIKKPSIDLETLFGSKTGFNQTDGYSDVAARQVFVNSAIVKIKNKFYIDKDLDTLLQLKKKVEQENTEEKKPQQNDETAKAEQKKKEISQGIQDVANNRMASQLETQSKEQQQNDGLTPNASAVTTTACDPVAGNGYNYGENRPKNSTEAMKKKLNSTTYTYSPNPKIKIVKRVFD